MTLQRSFLDRPIAHRALHDRADGRPENSREAILATVAAGYGIEIDVQCSRDGQAMVFHDYELSRLTAETGAIGSYDAADLQGISLAGGATGIPTLQQVLSLVAGAVPLLLEIKDQDGAMGPDVGPLGAAVAQALDGYAGSVALMSFNPHAVEEMATLCPDRPRGLTTCSYTTQDWPTLPARVRDDLRDIPDFDRVGASFISHEARDLDRPRVSDLKAGGIPILCWTIKSPMQEKEARRVADNITFEQYTP